MDIYPSRSCQPYIVHRPEARVPFTGQEVVGADYDRLWDLAKKWQPG